MSLLSPTNANVEWSLNAETKKKEASGKSEVERKGMKAKQCKGMASRNSLFNFYFALLYLSNCNSVETLLFGMVDFTTLSCLAWSGSWEQGPIRICSGAVAQWCVAARSPNSKKNEASLIAH